MKTLKTGEAISIPGAELAACTIISKNYISYARTLADSFLAHHPDNPFFVLLVDRIDGYFEPEAEKFHLIGIEELDIPDVQRFCFQYTILELNTAVKPYFLSHLFEKYRFKKLIYFDPDILITRDLSKLSALLDHHSIVLTPHLTAPIDDQYKPGELEILLAGAYNLGFLAVSATATTRSFLEWWQERLYTKCQIAQDKGMFVDQRWVDLVPGVFDGVYILRDPEYNVAYWNLHGRSVEFSDGRVTVNGRPCVFFHFSGFDPDEISMISKHQNRFTIDRVGSLGGLFESYRDLLFANGYRETKPWPFAFGRFSNGVRIPDIARMMYRALGGKVKKFGDPFSAEGPHSFFSWLQEGVDREPDPAWVITRLWYEIYHRRPDIQRIYPDVLGRDRKAFLAWFSTAGTKEYGIEQFALPGSETVSRRGAGSRFRLKGDLYVRFIGPLEPILTPILRRVLGRNVWVWNKLKRARDRMRYGRPLRVTGVTASAYEMGQETNASATVLGVNVAGYFESEKGVGEVARATVRALEAASVPYVLNNVTDSESWNREWLFSSYSEENPYPVNLVHVNADQAPVFASQRGDAYLRGRYNIGYWFWELSHFPEESWSCFQYFDEVWVGSNFVLDSTSRVSPIPVVKMPVALMGGSEGAGGVGRSHFGLSPDTFVFLFVFDFASVLARKNPLGLIEAFRMAFGGRDDVCLVLKSCHSSRNPGEVEGLRTAAEAANIKLIDTVLNRAELTGLLAISDCYVSLHRSEGFGLPIVEAMSLGKPVIVTAYSGNMDFTTPSNSFLVRYRLAELDRDYGPYKKGSVWADPSLDHAAELMRHVYENRAIGTATGRRAREDVLKLFDPRVVGAQMRDRLERILSRGGHIPKLRQAVLPSAATERASDAQVVADFTSLHAGYDVCNVPLTSHRRVVGPVIALARKLLRQLLTPILTRQVAYNAANTRVVTHLKQQVEALDRQQGQALQAMRGEIEGLHQRIVALQTLRERVSGAERKLRRILYLLTDGQQEPSETRVETTSVARHAVEGNFDYCGFEERFRGGSEEEIKERLRMYLEHFQGQGEVLDVGCGRGEFLELLREGGIKAKGVDADLDMVLLCREKGLDVIQADAFAHLESLPDESLGGVFAAQVIEHFSPDQIIRFVRLFYRKIRPGGIVVLETLNPQCLSVFARSFYMDFSHVWPCHPEAMRYLLESVGFEEVRVVFSWPVDPTLGIPPISDTRLFGEETDRFNRTVGVLNELLLGPQNYAIIGRRKG